MTAPRRVLVTGGAGFIGSHVVDALAARGDQVLVVDDLSVGSRARVDQLTAQLREAGVPILDGPRQTGDGYYESVALDPDGNRIEIAV